MAGYESLIPFIKGNEGKGVKVIIDSREASAAPKILKRLVELGLDVKITTLDRGDYLISDLCIIERKTVHDFVHTLTNRFLFDQLFTLKDFYPQPILLLEGYLPVIYKFTRINPRAVWGAIFTLAKYGIAVVPTTSWKETADFLLTAAKQEQLMKEREPVVRPMKKPGTLVQKQLYLIAGLPCIDYIRGETLLQVFGTPREVFSAKKEDLIKIRGIGEKIADAILEVLDTPYKKSE